MSVLVALGIVAIGIVPKSRELVERLIPGGPNRPPAIAVLPLVNLSGDPSEEYFADGLTEELITHLALVEDLRVTSRSSVVPYKNTKEPLQDVARKLHVQMVVEGSVSLLGDSVRVSTRLVDAGSGRAVWAGVYDRDLGDVLALRSEVAISLVRALKSRVTPEERERLVRARHVDPKAHAAYLQGLAAFRLLSVEGIQRALTLHQRAIAIDPEFADAWVGLACASDYGVSLSLFTPTEGRARMVAAATRALELDPENGTALALLATDRFLSSWDFEGAERMYREALSFRPGDADIRTEYSVLLTAAGRFDEALSEANRARELDPTSSLAATVSLFPLFEGRRFRECVVAAREVVAVHPSAHSMCILGQSLLFSGKHDEAIVMLRKAVEMGSGTHETAWLGLAYARTGRTTQANAMLQRLREMKKTQYVDPYCPAIVHAALGDREQALTLLEESAELRSGEIIFAHDDPALDPLRSEPRFQAILERIGPRARSTAR